MFLKPNGRLWAWEHMRINSFDRKSNRKGKFGISSHLLEDNIILFHKSKRCGKVDQIHIDHGRVQW